VYGQIAGWYKGNEGGEVFTQCLPSVGEIEGSYLVECWCPRDLDGSVWDHGVIQLIQFRTCAAIARAAVHAAALRRLCRRRRRPKAVPGTHPVHGQADAERHGRHGL